MHLRQAETLSQLGLTPAEAVSFLNELTAEGVGQAARSLGFDM
jgi:hypothetical protein